jgi:CubicO group peptidase (beta-lactamase class C family)
MRLRATALVVGLVLVINAGARAQQDFLLERFAQYLDSLRRQAGIPGLSVAIRQDDRVVWDAGFGYADLEAQIPATPDTPYHVVGLTQTFTAGMVLKCVERGLLDLDEPMRKFVPDFPEADAQIHHVLSHTSKNPPGAAFDYSLGRFSMLSSVVEGCTHQSYRSALARVLDSLAMRDSVPGDDVEDSSVVPAGTFDKNALSRYANTLEHLAKPYAVSKGRATLSSYPSDGINAATGLISTVRDLAKYDAGIDESDVLDPETLELAWTNATANDGRVLPHGLGWFVQEYHGEKVVWQFGEWKRACSALILKVPDRHLTLILLANSDGLTAPFDLSDGDVTNSLFARTFLGLFL